jgi:hypothetical protein
MRALGGFEALTDMRRSDREGLAGLMARHAAAPIGAQIQEKGIRCGVGGSSQDQIGKCPVRVRKYLKLRDNPIGIVRGGYQSAGSKKKEKE